MRVRQVQQQVKKKESTKAQLKREWEELLERHSKPLERGALALGIKVKPTTKKIEPTVVNVTLSPKVGFCGMNGPTPSKEVPTYTGTNMIGISVVHKSGLVPVFSSQQAEDLAKMRRG